MQTSIIKNLLAALFFTCCAAASYAADTYTWVGTTTTWEDAGNWNKNGSGTGLDFPGNSRNDDIAIIGNTSNNPVFTADHYSSHNIGSITLDGGGAGCTLDFNGHNINIIGNLVCTNSSTVDKVISGTGNSLVGGNVTGSGELNINGGGYFTISGNMTISTLTQGNGRLYLTGNSKTISAGYTFTDFVRVGTTVYCGSEVINGTMSIFNGTLIPGASDIISGSGSISGVGEIDVTATGNSNDLTHQYTVPFTPSANADMYVAYAGSTAQVIPAGAYGSLMCKNAAGVSFAGDVSLTGRLWPSTGTMDGSNVTITLQGDYLYSNGGNFSASNGTVIINSARTTYVAAGWVLNNLIIQNGSVLNVVNNMQVNGTLTVNSGGELKPGATNIISGTGTLTGTGTIDVYATGNSDDLTHQYTMATLSLGNATAAYRGSSAQTISGSTALGYLTINNSAGVTVSGTLTVAKDLTLTAGTLSLGANTLNLAGAVSGTTSNLSASSSTMVFNGASAQTIPSGTYSNITINNSNGVSLGASITVPNTLTLTSGTLALGANNLTLGSGGTISGGSSSSYIQINGTGRCIAKGVTSSTIPVGDEYAPVTISNGGGADYTIGLANSVTGSGGSPVLTTHAVGITWDIQVSAPVSNVGLTFQWPGANELGSFNRTLSFVAMRTSAGGTWAQQSASSAAGGSDPYTQSVTMGSMNTGTTYYFGVGDEASALPVSWASFAAAYKNGAVNLNWTTASEINNAYFSIERSSDGAHWAAIGTVPGHGSSNISHRYTAVDDLAGIVPGNILYYRLKQVDYNGKYEYSAIRTVHLTNTPAAFEIYPNPAANAVNITCGANAEGVIILKNISGQVLYTAKCTGALQTIDISVLNKGLYVITLQSGDMVKEQLLIKN